MPVSPPRLSNEGCHPSQQQKKETFVAFVLRAVANEVWRFLAELANGPVADRVKYHDLLELDILALLSDEEKKGWGL